MVYPLQTNESKGDEMAALNKRDFKRILFPTDFSEASENAALCALSLAQRYDAKLYVLHVVNLTEDTSGFYVPHISYEKLDEEMKAAAGKMMEKFTSRFFRGFENLESSVLAGEPYKEIIKAVKGSRIDVIVMGSAGKGKVDRFLFGSTAERVMRKVLIPVLIVPPSE